MAGSSGDSLASKPSPQLHKRFGFYLIRKIFLVADILPLYCAPKAKLINLPFWKG